MHKKLLRRVILVIFLSTIAIPASMTDIYSLDNGKGWIAFEKGKPEAIGLKDMALSREEIRQRKVRADKTRFSKGKFTSELRLKLDFPGAFLTRPDDNGLLAGRYDLLSLLPGKKAQTLTVNGSLQPDKLGKPNLAYVRLKVRLPYPVDKKDLSISVINADYIQLDGSYDIAPVQEELPESFRPGIDKDHRKFQMEKKVYKADKFFSPPLEYELITFHGVKIAEISFSPLQYNPVRKILKACPSAELLIRYNVGTENDIPSTVPTALVDGIVETFCFDGSSSSDSSPSDSPIMQMPALTESTGRFVIVSHSDLINTYTYDDYITYRENQGYVHLETIDTAGTLFDEPSEIRNRLLELYQDPGFDYLLLIGDETLVPISHEDGDGYHDKMYSRLDGDDSMPDVFMGRFLADNETGFRNILDHQIGQESSELAMNEVMMTWGIELYGNEPDLADRFSCSHYSTLIMDNPDGGLGYNVHRYYKTETLNIPRRYGGSRWIPVSEFEPWTLIPNPFYIDSSECTNAIIDRWNQGVAVIGHCDHGSTYGPSSPSIPYSIFSGQITSSSFPLFTSTNCWSGNFRGFHDDNFAYQSQVNTFGTCATFAATSFTYDKDSDYYHLAMYDAMFPDDGQLPIKNVGEIFLAGLLGSGWDRSRTYFHIFGDPMTTLTLGFPSGIEFNIISPQKGSYIRDVVNVTGTASGDEFENYELYYWNEETPDNKTLISSSTSPITDDVLGIWDTTGVYPDDEYVLGLKVTTNTDNYFWFYGGVIIDNYNKPPLFEQMVDKVAFIGEDLTFIVEVIDPDDPQTPEGTLTYLVEGLPEGASFDNATQTFSWTPQEFDLYKTYTVNFQVSDSEYTVSQELDIHVLELVQVTSDSLSQQYPVIYENIIVWHDNRNGNYDIYLYDLGEDEIYRTGDDRGEFQVTSDPSSQQYPVIYENKIVWRDYRNGNGDIYLYDLGEDGIYGTGDDRGEFQITSDPSRQQYPVIHENKIVWQDGRNVALNIYLYDLGDDGIYGTGDDRGEFQVTSGSLNQTHPVIYENNIVWYDYRSRNYDVYLYDLGEDGIYGTGDDRGEFRITSDPSVHGPPDIYENNIVWWDNRNGNRDICLYDLGEDGIYGTGDDRGEFQVTSDPSDQQYPVIYENKIVWEDYRSRNGIPDIYLYDLGEDGIYGTTDDRGELQVTSDPSSQQHPVIYENKIVWQDHRNGYWNWDIYMTILNQAPIFAPIGSKSVNEGQELTFTISATDPDGDLLTYSVTGLPDGASFNPSTGTFIWTPDYTQAGIYSVTFTVSDGSLTDSEIITITVNNINQPPSVGTVSPSSGSSNPGEVATFTTTYTDSDGWEQIRYGYFLVNDRISVRNCCFVQYDQNTNKLYLRDENHTVWLGGYEPGSANTIENSYVELHCADTSVSGADNTLAVTWGIVFKPAFRGNKKTYLYVTDDSGMSGGWWTQVGTWTINNQAPSVGTVTPSSGSSDPGEVVTFTTTYTDPDGWEQIKYAYFLVNDRVVIRDCFFGYYDQNTNKLYLRDDNHTIWQGGYEPGSANTIENSYVELRCADTSVSGADETLTITWSIIFKSTFRGAKKTYLYVTDDSGMTGGWWTQVGTWTINNQPPSVGTVTPSSGSSDPGQVATFSTTYTDLDGWEQIRYGYFLVNDRVVIRDCCFAQYDQNTNKLYLRDENHTVWQGGYEPGSANTIENSYVELHCADTSVSGADNTLTVTWGIVFKPAFRGDKKTYLYVSDDSGSTGGWWTQVGTWTIR